MRFVSGVTVIILLCLGVLNASEVKALSSYKWKNRLIIVYPEDKARWKNLQAALLKEKVGIKDRDLVVIRWRDLAKEDQAALVATGFSRGSYLLVGKDGDVKGKQTGNLDLGKWFALIDTMPMRKQEMRE